MTLIINIYVCVISVAYPTTERAWILRISHAK